MNNAVHAAAIAAGCTRRQADVIAIWIDAEGLDDVASELRISNRAVLGHLRAARHRLNVAHNGTLVWAIANPAYTRSIAAAR